MLAQACSAHPRSVFEPITANTDFDPIAATQLGSA
jgi:hypothetical protein